MLSTTVRLGFVPSLCYTHRYSGPMKILHMLLLLVLLGTTAAQGKAYRDINFGDPFEVVTQKVLEDEHFRNQFDHPIRVDTTVPERVLELQTQYVSIAGSRYQIRFHFYDEKLFRLRFFSDDYTANYFSTRVTSLRDRLVGVITAARGRPTATRNASFFDMDSGYIQWTHTWAPSSDGTEHRIGLGEAESTYYAAMEIQWAWLASLYQEALEQTDRSVVDESISDF